MSWVQRKSPSNVDITGFWNRTQGELLQGILLKYVSNDKQGVKKAKPFIIIQSTKASTATLNIEGEKDRKVKVGDYVGVSANWSIRSVLDMITDIGKEIRLTVNGTAVNPNGGKPMILFDVEVDELSTDSKS